MRTIVHLSDIHFGRVDTTLVPPLIAAIRAVAPDLVAVSGDLTQRATREQFASARAFLQQLPFAKVVVPGNHDVPLYNVAARVLTPLANYRRFITRDLAPVFSDDEIVVVGLNSVRAIVLYGRGRLNVGQVQLASTTLRSAAPNAIKIVVTHHPFDLPATHGDEHLIGRSKMAMAELGAAGADLFLAGHLHVSHVGHTATRYRIAGHSALVVQAGTLSTRGRGEANAFNVIRLARPRITVERYTWDPSRGAFIASASSNFRHSPTGWTAVP